MFSIKTHTNKHYMRLIQKMLNHGKQIILHSRLMLMELSLFVLEIMGKKFLIFNLSI